MFYKTLAIVIVLLFSTIFLFAGCSCKDKSQPATQKMPDATMHTPNDHSETHERHSTHDGGTMSKVNQTDALYTCPMHSEVVSTSVDTPCPLCKMKLNKMTAEQAQKLHASHPKGCPMDPIMVPGDSKTEFCPVCKMKLSTLEISYHGGSEMEAKTAGCSCCNS